MKLCAAQQEGSVGAVCVWRVRGRVQVDVGLKDVNPEPARTPNPNIIDITLPCCLVLARTCRYVRRLQKRYTPNPHLDPEDAPCDGPTPFGGTAASVTPTASTAGTAGQDNAAQATPSASSAAAAAVAAAAAAVALPVSRSGTPGPAGSRDPSLGVPVVFVSLLRKGTLDKDRSETKLASAFDAMAGALRKEHRLPLTYIALDWHEMDRVLGHEGIVEAFWSQVWGAQRVWKCGQAVMAAMAAMAAGEGDWKGAAEGLCVSREIGRLEDNSHVTVPNLSFHAPIVEASFHPWPFRCCQTRCKTYCRSMALLKA